MPGECYVTRIEDPLTGQVRLYLGQADPEILIPDEVLEAVSELARQGRLLPGIRFDGRALRIEAGNQAVVYELTCHDPGRRAWTARWPD